MGYLTTTGATARNGVLKATSTTVANDLLATANPLRLVKLRLSLSLVAMAVLPLAIAAPLTYSILDGQQNADRLRAERDSTALAAAIGTRLDRTQQAVARTAASPTLSGFLSSPQKTTTTTARATLLTLGTSTDDGVRDVMVQDIDGGIRICGGYPLLYLGGDGRDRTAQGAAG